MKILVIEDDSETAAFIARGLREAGATVDCAETGLDGLFLASEGGYDVMVVDRLLPKMDGLGVVRVLRGAGVATPVLFLTAVNGLDDRVEGLDAGGDDYMCQAVRLLRAERPLRALVRRAPGITVETVLRVGDLSLDRVSRRVERAGQEDRPAAAGVSPARVPDAACGGGGDPDDAARARLGVPFRAQDQRRRDPHEPAAQQGRQAVRRRADPDGAGRGLCHRRAPASLRAEIARSAAFRLTLRFAAVFVACLLVADLAVGFGARWIVRERTIAALDETLADSRRPPIARGERGGR